MGNVFGGAGRDRGARADRSISPLSPPGGSWRGLGEEVAPHYRDSLSNGRRVAHKAAEISTRLTGQLPTHIHTKS